MSLLAYPRISNGETQIIHQRMTEMAGQDPARLVNLVATSHPKAQPVPTGARIADEIQIAALRESVLEDLDLWLRPGVAISRSRTAEFDRALGSTLHDNMRIVPADAGHDATWNFLSAVVFPDVVWARYPDLHFDRVQGKRHRNTLRRAWFRHTIVGDLQATASRPLGEDEMTGLFERPSIAMNYQLIRLLAQMVLAHAGPNRMEYTRKLMKRTIALTGTYLLDSLAQDELLRLIDPESVSPLGRDANASMPSPGPLVHTARLAVTDSSPARIDPTDVSLERRGPKSLRQDSSDLVGAFHREMVRLCNRINAETGYRPAVLFAVVSRVGGVEAARSEVGDAHPSETFTWLWERNRGDLTVESLVLQEEYRGLFSEALLGRAAARINASF